MEEKQGTQGTGTSNGNGIFHIKEKIYEMILYGRQTKGINVYGVGNGGTA